MLPKPSHLGPQYGAQFSDASIVAAYHHRPPYPQELFSILVGLINDTPRTVLDIGCGTGPLVRNLAPLVDHVDAVDISAPMLAKGKQLPNGAHPNLRWIEGRVEDVVLAPPYSLIVAGASLHWMEWDVVLPRLRAMLTPNGVLALTGEGIAPMPWDPTLYARIPHFSTNHEYQQINLIDELTRRHLFRKLGEQHTTPVPWTQSVDDYVESFHARNGLSRDRMAPEQAAAFDAEVKALVQPWAKAGWLPFQLATRVVWGEPSPQEQL